MLRLAPTLFVIFMSLATSAIAQNRDGNVQQAIDLIVLFCVAGGQEVTTEVREGSSDQISINSPGRTVTLSSRQVRGLVDGISSTMTGLTAEQASEARNCMRPYIDRILSVLVPRNSDPSLFRNYYGRITIYHGTDGRVIFDTDSLLELRDGFDEVELVGGGRRAKVSFELRGQKMYVSGLYRGTSGRVYVIEGVSDWDGFGFKGDFRMIRPDRNPHAFVFDFQ